MRNTRIDFQWNRRNRHTTVLALIAIRLFNGRIFDNKLRETRINQKLTVPALSEKRGIPIRTIEDLERRNDGRVSTLIKLAHALGIPLNE